MSVLEDNRWVLAQQYDTTKPLVLLVRHTEHNADKTPMLGLGHLRQANERAVKPLVSYLQNNPGATVRFAHSASSWVDGYEHPNSSIEGEEDSLQLVFADGEKVSFSDPNVNVRTHGMINYIRRQLQQQGYDVGNWSEMAASLADVGATHEQGSSLIVPGLNNAEVRSLMLDLRNIYGQNKDTLHAKGGPLQHIARDEVNRATNDHLYSLWANIKEHPNYQVTASRDKTYSLHEGLEKLAEREGQETSLMVEQRLLSALQAIDSATQHYGGGNGQQIIVSGTHGELLEALGAQLDQPYTNLPGHVTMVGAQFLDAGITLYANGQVKVIDRV